MRHFFYSEITKDILESLQFCYVDVWYFSRKAAIISRKFSSTYKEKHVDLSFPLKVTNTITSLKILWKHTQFLTCILSFLAPETRKIFWVEKNFFHIQLIFIFRRKLPLNREFFPCTVFPIFHNFAVSRVLILSLYLCSNFFCIGYQLQHF